MRKSIMDELDDYHKKNETTLSNASEISSRPGSPAFFQSTDKSSTSQNNMEDVPTVSSDNTKPPGLA